MVKSAASVGGGTGVAGITGAIKILPVVGALLPAIVAAPVAVGGLSVGLAIGYDKFIICFYIVVRVRVETTFKVLFPIANKDVSFFYAHRAIPMIAFSQVRCMFIYNNYVYLVTSFRGD